MAKRELSSTLRNLKFMQRAAQKEEKIKREEEVKPDGNFFSPPTVSRKCIVIMEGDPHPGAVLGRMSFLSFNPSIDKLNEEVVNLQRPDASATSSGCQSGRYSFRDDGSSMDGAECSNVDKPNLEANGNPKRKQVDGLQQIQHPNKSPKIAQAGQQSSSHNSRSSFKQPKREKLDWNVLRPSKNQNKRG